VVGEGEEVEEMEEGERCWQSVATLLRAEGSMFLVNLVNTLNFEGAKPVLKKPQL
jgi:hypothetical protein